MNFAAIERAVEAQVRAAEMQGKGRTVTDPAAIAKIGRILAGAQREREEAS